MQKTTKTALADSAEVQPEAVRPASEAAPAMIDMENGLWIRPPKLRQELALLQANEEIAAAPTELEQVRIMLRVAGELFYVPDGQDYRPVTDEDMLDVYSTSTLGDVFKKYGEFTQKANNREAG